jgi:hypothetical protein
MVNVWTVLWVADDGQPFTYCTLPADVARPAEPETRLYKPQDVQKFERMVRRYLPDCAFRCLTNVDVPGIECVPPKSRLVGWWPKMELFRTDLPAGRNLYFDLDTLILGDISLIMTYPARFAAICPGPEVGADEPEPWLDQEGKWWVPRYQTSVMVWDSEYGHRFWEAFNPEHVERLASDQDFLGEAFPDEARMPTEWFTRIELTSNFSPAAYVKVVLTSPIRNDEAARRYAWAARIWC